ncbi:MAG: hypothetical protein CMQ41_07120 [Gammaproteobacteria bacterium]|nr:hypothetical protein [Gammaproteobacteria bacterium]|tara:strand:+ start:522 stop:1259 length:738 start_codon:yes stop_codon:yes gene_type:complete
MMRVAIFYFIMALSSFSFAQDSINPIINKLSAGEDVFGTFTRNPRFDLDFVVIDEQYNEINFTLLRRIIHELSDGDGSPVAAPIVRPPLALRDKPEKIVRGIIEAGAYGILFPDIEDRDQTAAAIASMQQDRDEVWGSAENGVLVAMIMIESPQGIANLEEIAQVPGVGVLFVGPTDMANYIGADGPNAPEVEAMVQQVLAICLEEDIACGYPIIASSTEDAERQAESRLEQGFKVLAVMTRTTY